MTHFSPSIFLRVSPLRSHSSALARSVNIEVEGAVTSKGTPTTPVAPYHSKEQSIPLRSTFYCQAHFFLYRR
ncbi:hypothetical protein HMPREF1869_01035 [Bacteroidales bacterium KA00251]|nr:hypothetical protein HMPREF1869_01035 [Bacteroidales bacterium KA00251]